MVGFAVRTKKVLSSSERVALGGITTALCLVVMFFSSVLPALYILSPMIAGVLLYLLAEYVSPKFALLTYVGVSILSLFMLFDKEAALMFVLFFGYYPILRLKVQKIRRPFPRVGVKFLLFNFFAVIDYFLTTYVFGLPSYEDTAPWMLWTMLILANIMFALYDFNLSQMGKMVNYFLHR